MDLERVRLEELSQIEWQAFLGSTPKMQWPVLVLTFRGEYGFGSGGNGDALFMATMATAALVAWESMGVILDFRELRYQCGDMLTYVLGFASAYYADGQGMPTVVITSPLCLEGLASLVEAEMGEDPADWLFGELDSAAEELERQMRVVYQPGRPTT